MKSAHSKRFLVAICAVSLGTTIAATGAQQAIRPQYVFHGSFGAAPQAAVGGKSLLYVSSENPSDIAVYPSSAAGRAKPIVTIIGPHTGLVRPIGIAVDKAGTSYVVNAPGYHETGSVTMVPYGNGDVKKTALLTCSVYDPSADALDAGGVHVTDIQYNSIATNKPGVQCPSSMIQGDRTLLDGPTAIAIDVRGRAVVANLGEAFINVYAAGAAGNVAPIARIIGSRTGIYGPMGVAVDAQNNIYVSNSLTVGIREFAATANGNATPIRTLSGPKTLLNNPRGIAVSKRTGEIYVAEPSAGQVLVYAAGAHGNVAPIRVITDAAGNQFPTGVALRE